MTLHIVSKSPFASNALRDCLSAFADGDTLLLIEDGVYALQGNQWEAVGPVYCLEADAQARGIPMRPGVQALDESGWVDLCTRHNPIVSWFQ
ncbi:sulfurtransferase complex subunit TusB [Microbulbifer sp. TYP-18]|uniref:sulfurtransferase complex subunit TusB n=1 Tax=Microbulbifer sp. TYP-18 TaxID=3230024 RepID=UPI0034C6B9C3